MSQADLPLPSLYQNFLPVMFLFVFVPAISNQNASQADVSATIVLVFLQLANLMAR
ncbi:MAG TPA: hypothetical protein VM715_06770 [Candidatus Acidoferrum sp.]|jgi:hypothetical protein|nr:hypothetical protein [Candidatus Acidoferrum sp.]